MKRCSISLIIREMQTTLQWGITSHWSEWPSSKCLSSVQSLSHVWLFATPWIAACQASLSITNFWSLPKPMSIELVMPSSHLILCCPLLLLPPILLSIRVFSNESTLQNVYKQTINAVEGVEKREPSYTASRNVNWQRHYREQSGGSLKS